MSKEFKPTVRLSYLWIVLGAILTIYAIVMLVIVAVMLSQPANNLTLWDAKWLFVSLVLGVYAMWRGRRYLKLARGNQSTD